MLVDHFLEPRFGSAERFLDSGHCDRPFNVHPNNGLFSVEGQFDMLLSAVMPGSLSCGSVNHEYG